jgi:hypothetical protein
MSKNWSKGHSRDKKNYFACRLPGLDVVDLTSAAKGAFYSIWTYMKTQNEQVK